MFPWKSDTEGFCFQNIMHLFVTVVVVVLSLSALIIIAISSKKAGLNLLSKWAYIALIAGATWSNWNNSFTTICIWPIRKI